MRGKLAILARLRLARRRAAPHPPSGGASGTFPRGGRLTYFYWVF